MNIAVFKKNILEIGSDYIKQKGLIVRLSRTHTLSWWHKETFGEKLQSKRLLMGRRGRKK